MSKQETTENMTTTTRTSSRGVKKEIDFRGKHYESKTALCEEYGISPSTFSLREKRGFTLEECVFGRQRKGLYDIDGKKYTLSELSEMSGVLENTLYNRIRSGISPADAISPDYKAHRRRGIDNPSALVLEYNGEKLSARDIAEMTGLPIYTVHARRRANWSTERIINTPIREMPKHSERSEDTYAHANG